MEIPFYIELCQELISNDLKAVLLDIHKKNNNLKIEDVKPIHFALNDNFNADVYVENIRILKAIQHIIITLKK